jgi:hypothetical protein
MARRETITGFIKELANQNGDLLSAPLPLPLSLPRRLVTELPISWSCSASQCFG